MRKVTELKGRMGNVVSSRVVTTVSGVFHDSGTHTMCFLPRLRVCPSVVEQLVYHV